MTTRLDLLGMTGLAPRRTISPRRLSPSYPLSARSALMGGASARTSGAAAISASWPGVRCRTTGRQSASVSFERRRVERQHDGIFAWLGQRLKDCAPSSALGPTVEAIVDGCVRAVFTRTIAPSCTPLQHVNNAADDAPVVVPIRPRQSRRQMWFDPRPLPVIQPKQTSAPCLAPESKTHRQENHVPLFRYRP